MLLKLINISLCTGSVLNFFKQALISPNLKKHNLDPAEPGNFRPIFKLPFLSKVVEKMVAEQLTTFLSTNDMLDKFQSGVRKMHY